MNRRIVFVSYVNYDGNLGGRKPVPIGGRTALDLHASIVRVGAGPAVAYKKSFSKESSFDVKNRVRGEPLVLNLYLAP